MEKHTYEPFTSTPSSRHTTFYPSERSPSPSPASPATLQQRQTVHARTGSSYSTSQYPPYSRDYDHETDTFSKADPLTPPAPIGAPRTKESRGGALSSGYMAVSGMMGFRERYTLLWFFIFGGALLGICLARIETFSYARLKKMTTPGEFYWFDRDLYRINYQIHVYMTTIGGILVGGQFVPSIRRNFTLLHRINGYVSLLLLIAGNVCGCIVSYRSFGGALPIQMGYYLMAVMLIGSGIMGYANARKNTAQHRKWMLRMVTYFSAVLTSRLIQLCAKEIISRVGGYYSVWRCDEIRYVLNDTLVENVFPSCFAPNLPDHYSVAVLATTMWDHADPAKKLYGASATRACQGMALNFGLLLHVIGVEIYLHYTEEANAVRYGYELKPKHYDGEVEPWIY